MSENSSESQSQLVPTLYIVGGVIVLLLIGALFVWGISALANRAALELDVIRDLFIIGLALEACIFGIVLIILLVMVIRLVNTVEFEIKPIVQKTNEIAQEITKMRTTMDEIQKDNNIFFNLEKKLSLY